MYSQDETINQEKIKCLRELCEILKQDCKIISEGATIVFDDQHEPYISIDNDRIYYETDETFRIIMTDIIEKNFTGTLEQIASFFLGIDTALDFMSKTADVDPLIDNYKIELSDFIDGFNEMMNLNNKIIFYPVTLKQNIQKNIKTK